MSVRYRLQQFWHVVRLRDRALPAKFRADVMATLSESEAALFFQQAPADQWHSHRVWQRLKDAGYTEGPLLAAALLHDVGKSRVSMTQYDRVAPVLLKALSLEAASQLGVGEPAGWRRPFVIRRRHADWGAELARRAGSDPETVRLIRQHQESDVDKDDHLLQALQRADGDS